MNRMWLFLFCFCSILGGPVFSQESNEAIEPKVEGPDTIDLLKAGNLNAWKVPSSRWHVEENCIVGNTLSKQTEVPEWLYTKQRFADFVFTCELNLTGDNHRNTGIYYRVNPFVFKGHRDEEDEAVEDEDWTPFEAPSGYEFDAAFHDPSEENYWGSLGDWYKRQHLRIFANQTVINRVYQPEKWNRLTLRARRNRLEYWVNGIKVLDYVDRDPSASREGMIGLQIHDGSRMEVRYKNIRVLPIETQVEVRQGDQEQ